MPLINEDWLDLLNQKNQILQENYAVFKSSLKESKLIELIPKKMSVKHFALSNATQGH